jgi:PmbA protein
LVADIEGASIPTVASESVSTRPRVWFGPRAVRALLAPVLVRLAGEEWCLAERDWPILDSRLTLVDDPLVAGRPGSRPIDDDGVPTQRITLIDGGHVVRGIFDLESGARRSVPSTGHAWRRGFRPPRIGFSNVVLEGGTADQAELTRATEGGLWVRSLRFGPAPNPVTGTFRMGVPWAYRIEQGVVVGRMDGLVLSGNVFELLKQLVAIGNDGQWIGSAAVPSIVVDGVSARLR